MQVSLEAVIQAWMLPGLAALTAVVATYVIYRLALALFRQLTDRGDISRMFLESAARALGWFLCLSALNVALVAVPSTLPVFATIDHIVTLLLIVAGTWVAVRFASAIGNVIVALNPVSSEEWRRARSVETQTRFLIRGLNIIIVIVGFGAALMTFPSVRQLGTSLLASAGIGGIILGFAARPVLGNLLAGMQIALTQPFRIDDVLNVQGEWCWVEEVTATYVVLRVWDLRRLVVPLQWFIENPFQNWSRHTADIRGAALLWLDYGMPLQPLRDEFARLLRESPQWNKETETVQVVEATDHAMQVRFLMSAADSSALWDLRCAIREGLIQFVREHYPQYLPRMRAGLVDVPGEPRAQSEL